MDCNPDTIDKMREFLKTLNAEPEQVAVAFVHALITDKDVGEADQLIALVLAVYAVTGEEVFGLSARNTLYDVSHTAQSLLALVAFSGGSPDAGAN